MQRPLDIIPELVGAVYNTTTASTLVHKGTLYVLRDMSYSHSSLVGLVVSNGANLFVHSIWMSDSLAIYGSHRREQTYRVRCAVVKPDRATTQLRLRIMK